MMLKMPMSHFRFLEMISEGLFIEGFNHGRAAADHVKLEAYTTEQLEELVDTSKRRCQRPRMRAARQNIRDNLLCAQHESMSEHQIRSVPKWAIDRGRAYCGLTCCPETTNKASSSSHRHKQAPRAKAGSGVWCVRCERAFHPACYTIYHRGAQSFDELVVSTPPSATTSKSSTGRARGTKRRLVDSESEEETDQDEQ